VAAHDDGKGGNDAPAGTGGDGPFSAWNMKLLGRLPLSAMGGGPADVLGADIWGWVDPLTSREYAIYTRSNGTSFIDVTNPTNPIYLGNLPTVTGNKVWRDVDVYKNHAFIIADQNGAHGMQIFDLTRLRGVTSPQTFTEDAHYAGFANAHTISINPATGFAYAVGTNTFSGGLHVVNVNTPTAPVAAGGFAGDGYTHEAQIVTYNGPHAAFTGKEIAFCANEDTLTIVDVTNKASMSMLARKGYAGSGYTHQGWLTPDHTYFISDDELDEVHNHTLTRTHIWNVTNLTDPLYVGYFEHALGTIDHNLYINGNYIYMSNYTSGLRVFRIDDLANKQLTPIAWLDTYPTDDDVSFNGSWGNYPFLPSGNILISDRQNGLFIAAVVPEPGTLVLTGLAASLVGGVCWRQRRGMRR
jgi:choice-of-anchor B domain-containing protein